MKITLLLALFLSLTLSCAKKEAPAKLSLSFQSKAENNASNVVIEHVIVNVSASDLPLKVFEWECDRQDCSNISFEVLSGSGRMIQLLVLTEDSTEITKINYGDVLSNLTSGDNVIEVQLARIGQILDEAKIMGRYIPRATHPLSGKSLTGEVMAQLPVGSGKPDMRIKKFEIFGGWLNLFTLDSLGFRYRFTGHDQLGNFYANQPILNDLHDIGGLKISSAGIQPNTNRIVHYDSNHDYFNERDGVFEQRGFERIILGFFGQNLDSRSLCADPLLSSYSFNGSNGGGRICKNATCTTYFNWSDFIVSGSVNGDADDCTVGNNNEFKVNLRQIMDQRNVLNFTGPFLAQNTSSKAFNYNTTTGVVTWSSSVRTYLPAGVEVFSRNLSSAINWQEIETRNDGGLFCDKLTDYGYRSMGVFSKSGSMTLPASELGSNSSVIICARKPDGVGYFETAAVLGQSQYGGGGVSAMPERISLTRAPNSGIGPTTHSAVCYPFLIELQTSAGSPASSASSFDINLSATDSNMFIAQSKAECEMGGSPGNILTVPVHNREVVYVRTNSVSGSFVLNATTGTLIPSSFSFQPITNPMVITEVRFIPDFYRASNLEIAVTEVCIPTLVAAFNNNTMTNFNGVTFQFQNADFYGSEQDCEVQVNAATGTIGPAYSASLYWMRKNPGWMAGTSVGNFIGTCTGGAVCAPSSMDVVLPGLLTHIHADSRGEGQVGYCQTVKVGAFDNHYPNSYPVQFGSALAANPLIITNQSSAQSFIFQDSVNGCHVNPIALSNHSIAFSPTDTFVKFHYRPEESGTDVVDFDLNIGPQNTRLVRSFNIASDGWLSSTWAGYSPLTGPTYNFGSEMIGVTATPVVITFTNLGFADATAIVVSGAPAPFAVIGDTCTPASPIVPSETCQITLEFTPSSLGPFTDYLEIEFHNGMILNKKYIQLTGTGI